MKDSEREFREFLQAMSLSVLRIIGRDCGVAKAAALQKGILIDKIADLYAERMMPEPRSNRGAPVKESYLDPAIKEKLDEFRRRIKGDERVPQSEPGYFTVASPEVSAPSEVKTGILEVTQSGYGFLRARNCQPSVDGDVFIASPAIHALKLRPGDFIACTAKPKLKSDAAALDEVLSVNGLPVGKYEKRPIFDALTAQHPMQKLRLETGREEIATRMIDLFMPIGKGQRALIIAPPKAGKTTLLKSVARAISENHKEVHLIILLIDERPEEVTDIRASVEGAEVIYSTFDEGADHHIRAAELTLAHAKRIAELGKDVVILLDSLTKLTRAYNHVVESTGKTLTGGLDAAAFAEPKKFFGAARNTVEAGSLTILATALVETGSRMDDIIYEEFKGTGNADIFLSRDLAERRIFPAIDIRRSGTRKEELLLSREEIAAVYKMRERGLTDHAAGVIDMFKRTESNADFVERLPEWIKIYKNNI